MLTELLPDEYINVWDACGQLGYLIPWARWKAQSISIYLTGNCRRYVDTKFVHLLSRESVNSSSFASAAKGMPIVFLEDYKGGPDGIDWEKVRLAIIDAARKGGCVMQAVPVPSVEDMAREIHRVEVGCAELLDQRRAIGQRFDDMVVECRKHQATIEKLRMELLALKLKMPTRRASRAKRKASK